VPEEEPSMSDVKITVRPNGPYLVEGPISLVDGAGNSIETGEQKILAFCRCGGSTNKPFCDGTHSKIGFAAAERAVEQQG
jgi:CDGSH-type Zn-finger protein